MPTSPPSPAARPRAPTTPPRPAPSPAGPVEPAEPVDPIASVAGGEEGRAGAVERLRRALRGDRGTALALGAGALAVYVRTLLPGVGYSGDTAKWQFLGEVGGTPHPTGYPLYLLLNRAWVHAVPVGELAWRVNLLSAVLGAATVATLFLLLRALDVRPAVAAATAATYAVTLTFWSQAVVAEVYTLHLFFLAAVTLCLVRWLDDGPSGPGGSDRWLLVGLGLYALSFGNHLGSTLALPGVAWLVWRGRGRVLRPRNLAWVALFAAVGAGQYAYLVRMTAVGVYVEQPVHNLGDIVGMVTGGRFRSDMFAFGPGELVRDRLPMFGRLLRSELGVLLVPAAYGLVRACRGRHRAVAVHLALLAVLAATYAVNFDVLDVFVFFLPCYLALAVFLGIGLDGAAEWLGQRAPHRRWTWAAAAALATIPLVTAAVNYPRASQRGEVADARRIERAIDAAGTDAVLITDNYADSEYLWYYLLGEDLRDERDLKLGNQLTSRQVELFFDRRRGPLARIATRDTPVYTATTHQAWALAAKGLTVTQVDDHVWRIGPKHGNDG